MERYHGAARGLLQLQENDPMILNVISRRALPLLVAVAALALPVSAHAAVKPLKPGAHGDRVAVMQGADVGLDGVRLAQDRAELVEDVGAVIDEDAAPRARALRAPGRRPVGAPGVGLGAAHLVIGEMDASDPGQQRAHGAPVRGIVVLVAGLENDTGRAHRLRDRLRLRERGRQRLLTQDVHAPAGRLLDEKAMAVRGRADVREVERLVVEQVLGLGIPRRGREERPRGVEVGPGEIGNGDDLDLLPQPRVAGPLRAVAAQRDVARAEQRSPQLQCQRPSRAISPKTSSRIPSAVSADARSMDKAGLMRKCGP